MDYLLIFYWTAMGWWALDSVIFTLGIPSDQGQCRKSKPLLKRDPSPVSVFSAIFL